MKRCIKCGHEKPLSEFYAERRNRDGHKNSCKECCRAYNREWQARDPENARRRWREASKKYGAGRQRKMKYGITQDDYDRMRAEQDFCCAICHIHESEIKGVAPGVLCVDHDAETGLVRGLLCDRCNVGIGVLCHDIERLESAIRYLLASQAA